MAHFKKELAQNPLFRSTGARINFELTGHDIGLLVTDDEELISEIRGMITQQRGGMLEISDEEYADLKKNPLVQKSRKPLLGHLRTAPNPSPGTSQQKRENVVEGNPGTRNTPRKVSVNKNSSEKLSAADVPPPVNGPTKGLWKDLQSKTDAPEVANAK